MKRQEHQNSHDDLLHTFKPPTKRKTALPLDYRLQKARRASESAQSFFLIRPANHSENESMKAFLIHALHPKRPKHGEALLSPFMNGRPLSGFTSLKLGDTRILMTPEAIGMRTSAPAFWGRP
jgi:hypothetical protein